MRIREAADRYAGTAFAELDLPKHAGTTIRTKIDADGAPGVAGSLIAAGLPDDLGDPFVVEERYYAEQRPCSPLTLETIAGGHYGRFTGDAHAQFPARARRQSFVTHDGQSSMQSPNWLEPFRSLRSLPPRFMSDSALRGGRGLYSVGPVGLLLWELTCMRPSPHREKALIAPVASNQSPSVFHLLFTPRMLLAGIMGFSSGLPILLSLTVLQPSRCDTASGACGPAGKRRGYF
jgi:hypothetical protein